jgi:hypothetical protein
MFDVNASLLVVICGLHAIFQAMLPLSRAVVIFGVLLTSLALLLDIYPFIAGHTDAAAFDLSAPSAACSTHSNGTGHRSIYRQCRPGSGGPLRPPR